MRGSALDVRWRVALRVTREVAIIDPAIAVLVERAQPVRHRRWHLAGSHVAVTVQIVPADHLLRRTTTSGATLRDRELTRDAT